MLKASSVQSAPSSRPLVAVVGFSMRGLDAEILRGVQEFAHTHNWQLFNANSDWGVEQIKGNSELVRGVIAVVADDARAVELRKMNCPVVNVSNTYPETYGFPAVVSQDSRVGELAFEYFQERGYSNYAVYFLPGQHTYRYINARAEGFMKAVEAGGQICHGILDAYPEDLAKDYIAKGWTMKTFKNLPKPCGIFCVDDQQGSYISFLAMSRGLNIPSEVGVLGGDNFELYCNMSNPPLSSVDLDGKRIGHVAAKTLHRLLPTGKPALFKLIEVPPGGVISRSTVDTSAIQEPLLAQTRQYILEHCHERINVSDIVRGVGTNRRKLEDLYQRHLGRTLLHALNQARVDKAIRLIKDTPLPLYEIATLCGFRDAHQMNRVFVRLTEQTPREFRATDR